VFQTEINLALQSAGSPPVTWLLEAVTLLGYTPVYVVLLVALAFAVRLRPGLAVVGGLVLTGLATDAAKNAGAFPRPDEGDPRVAMSAAARPLALAGPGGGGSFWALPQPEAVEAVRRRATGNYGFPSGHVGAAAAFLLCTAWFYRSKRVLAFAAAWVPLMALSRLYLGRHFLADVLGGLALGVAVSAVSFVLFRGFAAGDGPWPQRRAMRPLWLLGLVLLAATPFSPVLNPRYVGALVGLGLSGGAFPSTGPSLDGGDATRRAKRVLVALALFTVTFLGTEGLAHLFGGPGRLAAFLSSVTVATATLAGTAAACRRLALHGPRP
jgi:membrane-associated phospholipid phosphatase